MEAREQTRWMVVIPPEGAARMAAEQIIPAFASLGENKQESPPGFVCKSFDTRLYMDGFERILKKPDDDMVVDLMNQSFLTQCLDFKATHVLVTALSPITLFTLNLLRNQKIRTLHWFYEDFRAATYWRQVLAGYDTFLAIQKGEVQRACLANGMDFHFLPTAAALTGAPEIRVRPWRDRPYDVAFVGIPSPYRVRFLEALARSDLRLVLAGDGWQEYRGPLEGCLGKRSWVGEAEAAGIYASARIGLNLSFSDPEADRANTHISPRAFDILLAGAALLTEAVPLAWDTLEGLKLNTFKDCPEALCEIQGLLAKGMNSEEVEGNRGRILSHHLYMNRVGFILSL